MQPIETHHHGAFIAHPDETLGDADDTAIAAKEVACECKLDCQCDCCNRQKNCLVARQRGMPQIGVDPNIYAQKNVEQLKKELEIQKDEFIF